jgi:putative FmdB family regulatory protein
MPIYEYHCRSCGQDFQHTEPISEHGQHRTVCPKCRSTQIEQVMTPFFAKTGRKA